MKAAALYQHGNVRERSRHQLALVADDAGLRKAGDLGIRDAHGVLHLVPEEAEAGSQDDRHAGTALPETASHRVGGGANRRFALDALRLLHNSMPASVADRK